MVRPKRGYKSALPSARRQNLSELPILIRSTGPRVATKASSSGDGCERLSTIRVQWDGGAAAWMRVDGPLSCCLQTPRSRPPKYTTSNAGAPTTASTGQPSAISAMLIVNSPLPEMNSFVPSSGSTSQNSVQSRRSSNGGTVPSSEMIGVEGVHASSSRTINRCAA